MIRAFFSLTLLVFLLAFSFGIYSIFIKKPDFDSLKSSIEITVQNKKGEKVKRRFGPREAGWVELKNISEYVVHAVIASEDTSFFQHQGLDLHEIKQAFKKDVQEKKFVRGASTITQQVTKNAFLNPEKTFWRKLKEAFWATQLEKSLSKNEILNFYLNLVEWGPGIYGISEASSHYFNKNPKDITPKEAAFLAMLLPSPKKYYRYFTEKKLTKWGTHRVEHILKLMNRFKYISEFELDAALKQSFWEQETIEETEEEPLTE